MRNINVPRVESLCMRQMNPFEIYILTIGDEVSLGKFLSIKWAAANGLIYNPLITHIIPAGNLECLMYLHESPWDKRTTEKAASNGHLDCLKYAHEEGCPWDESTYMNALRHGHSNCLEYLRENGCPWDWVDCMKLAHEGQLNSLHFSRKKDDPWDIGIIKGYLDCIKYLYRNGPDNGKY